jgi:hypothetical protein
VCGAVRNAADGTVCRPTSNPCQNAGVCRSGTCTAITNKPDGTQVGTDAWYRCCGGSATHLTSTSNCNGCGITCASGESCIRRVSGGPFYCSCNGVGYNSQCWSHCCSTFYGAPYVCAASSCGSPATCTGCTRGETCHGSTSTNYPYYCSY